MPSLRSRTEVIWLPIALGITTALGLLLALLGGPLWAPASWAALALPLLATTIGALRKR